MTDTTYAALPAVPGTGEGAPGDPLRIAVIAASVRDQRMGRAIAEWAAFRAAPAGADSPRADSSDTGSSHTGSSHTGSSHAGSSHAGSSHAGSSNTGSSNTGASNTGSRSAGSRSAGSARADASQAEVDLIDCAETDLPDDGLLRPGASAGTAVSARIDAADAFVFVTPEYNHSYPAGLKRLIDWHYREWMFKPATVLSYGVQGGLLATEHLRGVLAELHVVTTRRVVGLSRPWTDLSPAGYTPPADIAEAFDAALHELTWWASMLRTARHERPYAR
ncbi:hypothetical protein Ait01nite_054880 [Actinoplanes italicus]|uniref:NAD(P)H-dependent FMN reductase n=1 Tax=Actinoplanes italicus TaxID=113567 RepID=A0A2T0K7I0_9ACTN|nr:NAD(P)H-dependent oxidoreductase [Actinoplanes italicus]PRX18978.1 NAD(P)H-dependent FMN reductase [Actinoplanes italicus]GIE32443.1 hypothetical protein Ait01nite_054880 [Actinoplanes italicus]